MVSQDNHDWIPLILDDTGESVTSSLDDPVLNRIIVNVFMIDLGTAVDVTLRNIRPLEAKFAKTQAQAIHCMMGGIAPVDFDANTGKYIARFFVTS